MSLRPSTLDSRVGPNGSHRHPERDAGALPAEREELRREPGGLPVLADRLGARLDLVARLARRGHAGQVALDVGREHRHADAGELLGHQLQGLGLAGAGGAGDQAVPVEHRQRDPDVHVGEVGGIEHQPAELERWSLEQVAGGDRRADRVVPSCSAWRHLRLERARRSASL